MKKLEYTVSFTTPAFLGNAEQQAQWRTPPFKALIRQWWRVVHGPAVRFDPVVLRRHEGELFGSATDSRESASQRSLVQLRLREWAPGRLENKDWPRRDMQKISAGKNQIPADVYIGYGPILPESRKQGRLSPLVERSAIAPGESNVFSLLLDSRVTPQQGRELEDVMHLVSCFGTLGSRARNGWGSLSVERARDSEHPVPDMQLLARCTRPMVDCFALDWPHALGADDRGPLVWVGAAGGLPVTNWREAIVFFAQLRRDTRAAVAGLSSSGVSASHVVGYPITGSDVRGWGNKERLANGLRFKLLQQPGGVVPVVVHLPSDIPADLAKKLGDSDRAWVKKHLAVIWSAVHKVVDARMRRAGESA